MLSKTRSFAQLPPRNQPETVNFLQTSTQQHTLGEVTQPGALARLACSIGSLSSLEHQVTACYKHPTPLPPPPAYLSLAPNKHACTQKQTPLHRETPSTVFRKKPQEKR